MRYIVMLFIICFSITSNADWMLVGSTYNLYVYIDSNSIKYDKSYRITNTMVSNETTTRTFITVIDCEYSTYSIIEQHNRTPVLPIDEESILFNIKKIVCGISL